MMMMMMMMMIKHDTNLLEDRQLTTMTLFSLYQFCINHTTTTTTTQNKLKRSLASESLAVNSHDKL